LWPSHLVAVVLAFAKIRTIGYGGVQVHYVE